MQLVFIHGWGFTPDFWNPLSELLPEFSQRRVDLGFYGRPSEGISSGEEAILIGHSLGFVHGIAENVNWKAWIAINSFPRFIKQEEKEGCVAATELQQIKMGLSFMGKMALQRFYSLIEASVPEGAPHLEQLKNGLDELRDCDVEGKIKELNVPGLVLASHNDPLVPLATSEALGRMTRKCAILCHETGGHILPLRDPAWCAEMIKDFIKNSLDKK